MEHRAPDQRETTDRPAECTCWNKGLANCRSPPLEAETHTRVEARARYTHTGSRHPHTEKTLITVPFLGVSISITGMTARFLSETISFTGSGMSFILNTSERKSFTSETMGEMRRKRRVGYRFRWHRKDTRAGKDPRVQPAPELKPEIRRTILNLRRNPIVVLRNVCGSFASTNSRKSVNV